MSIDNPGRRELMLAAGAVAASALMPCAVQAASTSATASANRIVSSRSEQQEFVQVRGQAKQVFGAAYEARRRMLSATL